MCIFVCVCISDIWKQKKQPNANSWLHNLFSFIPFLEHINKSISHPNIQQLYEGKSLAPLSQFSFAFLSEASVPALAAKRPYSKQGSSGLQLARTTADISTPCSQTPHPGDAPENIFAATEKRPHTVPAHPGNTVWITELIQLWMWAVQWLPPRSLNPRVNDQGQKTPRKQQPSDCSKASTWAPNQRSQLWEQLPAALGPHSSSHWGHISPRELLSPSSHSTTQCVILPSHVPSSTSPTESLWSRVKESLKMRTQKQRKNVTVLVKKPECVTAANSRDKCTLSQSCVCVCVCSTRTKSQLWVQRESVGPQELLVRSPTREPAHRHQLRALSSLSTNGNLAERLLVQRDPKLT